jgi:anthranilate/para-aminobenzoate synthase component I
VAETEFEETRQKGRALVRAAKETVRFAAGKAGGNAAV